MRIPRRAATGPVNTAQEIAAVRRGLRGDARRVFGPRRAAPGTSSALRARRIPMTTLDSFAWARIAATVGLVVGAAPADAKQPTIPLKEAKLIIEHNATDH